MKRTFRYCKTHKADEAYMQEMCSKGYAAVRLVEGFWTFEECKKNEYCYRVCYLRGMSKKEIEAFKEALVKKDIEFVSNYSFWGILRSKKEFELYNKEEELDICKKIYAPMPIGVIISTIVGIILTLLALKFSLFLFVLASLVFIYDLVCIYLAISYHNLIKSLKDR